MKNKKVLLRERKRHTARRVASTHYAALSNPDLVRGGYPIQTELGWGTLPPEMGYPLAWDGVPPPLEMGNPRPGMGYPPRPGMGYPPKLGWGTPPDLGQGIPLPRPGMGYPPTQTWDGVPPYLDLRWGTPYPDLRWGTPPKIWTDTRLWKHNLPSYYVRGR